MGLRVGRLRRVDRALRLPALGWAAGRGVGGAGCQLSGFDLEIGSDEYFDHAGLSQIGV